MTRRKKTSQPGTSPSENACPVDTSLDSAKPVSKELPMQPSSLNSAEPLIQTEPIQDTSEPYGEDECEPDQEKESLFSVIPRGMSFLISKASEYWEVKVFGKDWIWKSIISFGVLLPFVYLMDAFLFLVGAINGDMALIQSAVKINIAWTASFLTTLLVATIVSLESFIQDEKDRVDITASLSVVQHNTGACCIVSNSGSRISISKSELRLLLSHRKVRKFAGIHDPIQEIVDIGAESVPVVLKGASTIERASPV